MPNNRLMLFIILIGMALGLGLLAEILRIPILDGVLAILALLLTVVAFLTKNYIYLFDAVRKKKGKNLVLNANEAFVLAPNGNAIIRQEQGSVYASAFVRIPIYKSGTDMTKDEKIELSRLFGRILTLSKDPVKISSQLYMINKDEYMKKLRDVLSEAEERYRETMALGGGEHGAAIERARGEMTMWRSLMDNVSKSHSQALIVYAMVTAQGGNEEEAASIAYQRADELAGGISAALGILAYVVTGQEILTMLEPEHMVPVEVVNQRIMHRTMGGE